MLSTVISGGIDLVLPGADGEQAVHRDTGAADVIACNCGFEGSTLWVADDSTTHDRIGEPTGRLWKLETTLDGAVT